MAERLRARLQAAGQSLELRGHRVDAAGLDAFYAGRGYRPLWIDAGGPRAALQALGAALREAAREGLRPGDYPGGALARLAGDAAPAARVDLELLASHGLVRYAGDLRNGRLAPAAGEAAPFAPAVPAAPAELLAEAAAADDMRRFLEALAPANPIYRRLRRALADYRAIEARGGWPEVAAGPSLREGDAGPRVAALRARLAATGDISVRGPAPEIFDAALAQAVRRFQTRHGLQADAVVGPNTRAALNLPAAERVRQIVVNMERWRWMPDDLGERYILVNLAGFELEVVEAGSVAMDMRVVVGRPYRRTPVFTGRMTYLEFNPTWTVPPTIARLDILPEVRKDPGYLANNHMAVYAGWAAGAPPVDPAEVDWAAVDPRRIAYRFVQSPGPHNALGRVKFMFPNRYHVYLHDTPKRELFAETVRAFSSGCIRVEKPLELADYLLRDDPSWTAERVREVIGGGKRTTVTLPRALPVHLTYSTAWIGEGGTVHFRNDLYGRDALLDRALAALGGGPGG